MGSAPKVFSGFKSTVLEPKYHPGHIRPSRHPVQIVVATGLNLAKKGIGAKKDMDRDAHGQLQLFVPAAFHETLNSGA
jgi:hypothetical protein